METLGYSVLAVLFASVVGLGIASPPQSISARILGHGSLRFFGRYSYGLYVLHHPILYVLRQYVGVRIYPLIIFTSRLPGQLVFTILVTGVSLASAMLSWPLFESQVLKLKARFPYTNMSRPTNDARTRTAIASRAA
jgi:peptidoglycan/LPS O-acetylase OafA/YrhL